LAVAAAVHEWIQAKKSGAGADPGTAFRGDGAARHPLFLELF